MLIEDGEFAGMEVYIELEDGTRLNEYPGPVDTTLSIRDQREVLKTLCCYLECPADRSKSFKIAVKPSDSLASDYLVRAYADGQGLVKKHGRISSDPPSIDSVYQSIDGARSGVFSSLINPKDTTDDVTTALSPQLSIAAGRIEVTLQATSFTGRLKPLSQRLSACLVQKPIHEKAKKAFIDTSIQLGQGKRCVRQDHRISTHLEPRPDQLDIAVIFLYRSRELLMAQDIIERPAPNPLDPGAATTASKSGGPKDRQRLIQEAEELRERLRALEGELEEVNEDVKPTVKRTGSQTASTSAKKRPRQSGKVVDLTCDSD